MKKKDGSAGAQQERAKLGKQLGVVVFWLLVWQVAELAVGNPLILAGPSETVLALIADFATPSFWLSLAVTFSQIALGFVLAFASALLLGAASWKLPVLGDFLEPLVSFVKSVPVVCIIVLLLVWVGAPRVSLIVVALTVFPPVYFSFLEGLLNLDSKMRQMLGAYRVPGWQRLRYYYWPAVKPYVVSAAKVVVGVAWKSGVAAEVIGLPDQTVGESIYAAKIGLDTAHLFAWTFTIVAASVVCEKLFLLLLDALEGRSAVLRPARASFRDCSAAAAIEIDGMDFTYGRKAGRNKGKAGQAKRKVFEGFSFSQKPGGRCCLMGPSGHGKTTLLDVVCGLQDPDNAESAVLLPKRAVRMFQEDRLLGCLSAWDNVCLVASWQTPAQQGLLKFDLDELLETDSAKLSIDACSGGMKRKIALMRALAAKGDALILDEPFAGMDELSRTDAVLAINNHLRGRTLLVSTHDPDDVQLLQADRQRLL